MASHLDRVVAYLLSLQWGEGEEEVGRNDIPACRLELIRKSAGPSPYQRRRQTEVVLFRAHFLRQSAATPTTNGGGGGGLRANEIAMARVASDPFVNWLATPMLLEPVREAGAAAAASFFRPPPVLPNPRETTISGRVLGRRRGVVSLSVDSCALAAEVLHYLLTDFIVAKREERGVTRVRLQAYPPSVVSPLVSALTAAGNVGEGKYTLAKQNSDITAYVVVVRSPVPQTERKGDVTGGDDDPFFRWRVGISSQTFPPHGGGGSGMMTSSSSTAEGGLARGASKRTRGVTVSDNGYVTPGEVVASRAYWKLLEACYRMLAVVSEEDGEGGAPPPLSPGASTAALNQEVVLASSVSESVSATDKNSDDASGGSGLLCHMLKGSRVALDCGAAPGGWTQVLLKELDASVVIAVDPAELDDEVASLAGVEHWKCGIDEALQRLTEEQRMLDCFVCDACFHDCASAIDTVEKAAAILNPGALLVLTLKVVQGHSTASCQAQVLTQTERLHHRLDQMEVFHLMANRARERTIVGYWRGNS